MAPSSRELWQATEALHAVVYFGAEVAEAVAGAGVKGWWRGYFAGRAAPMGAVAPSVVTAAFANFAPEMVERALPSAWASASPTAVMAARDAGLEALFTRIDGDDGALVGALAPALDLLDRAADGAPLLGRPLAAAWAARRRAVLDGPVGPSVALRAWLAATVLREQRGDAHVAAAAAVGLDGCELHLTLAGTGRVPGELLRDARGWSAEEWQEASDRLVVRGLLRPDGGLTSDGLATRVALEDATDRASAQAWGVLADEERTQVLLALRPLGALVVERVPIRVPNPMGWEPLPL